MASLYRKPITFIDPKTNLRVKGKSKKWWGQYRDADRRLRRVPLAVDRISAQALLNRIVRDVERQKAGLVDPTDEQRKRPLADHVAEFKNYLENNGITLKQVAGATRQIKLMISARRWKFVGDITASGALEFLGGLRTKGLSAQTFNHYLKSAKQFTRWLVRDGRTPSDPLVYLSKLNAAADRRHYRRALSEEEFARLIEAARQGKSIESICGPDRAMMYIVAAWTGFRRGEIGSLTKRSLRLDDDLPTITVAACYTKNRRQDTMTLHADVAQRLRQWLETKNHIGPDDLLFPVSDQVPGGVLRKTEKMVRLDLEAARKKWIEDAKTEFERMKREQSDFLEFRNDDGLYADFHSLRHLFITRLERAGISPKMAQTLARHSDIRLTLGLYTHLERHDQSAAIAALPAPPGVPQNDCKPFSKERMHVA